MTENEAKTKWCPMFRSSVEPNGSADNRGIMNEAGCHKSTLCIASECMAWRWDWTPEDHTRLGQHKPEGNGWVDTGILEISKAQPAGAPLKTEKCQSWGKSRRPEWTGHCGLAGQK